MASYQAITTVCQGIVNLLHAHTFDAELEFAVYSVRNLSQPMRAGVSLLLYRIVPNGTYRVPPGRTVDGQRQLAQLPVDLHFLLTAWGEDASTQNLIAGWMMRTMADYPILPMGMLNATTPDVFRPDEIVEVTLGELSNEDLFTLWDSISENNYQLSVPYLARNLRLESDKLEPAGPAVQTRILRYTDDLQ